MCYIQSYGDFLSKLKLLCDGKLHEPQRIFLVIGIKQVSNMCSHLAIKISR